MVTGSQSRVRSGPYTLIMLLTTSFKLVDTCKTITYHLDITQNKRLLLVANYCGKWRPKWKTARRVSSSKSHNNRWQDFNGPFWWDEIERLARPLILDFLQGLLWAYEWLLKANPSKEGVRKVTMGLIIVVLMKFSCQWRWFHSNMTRWLLTRKSFKWKKWTNFSPLLIHYVI